MDAPTSVSRKPCLAIRLRRTARRLGFLALLAAVTLVALKYWGFKKLDDEIVARVEEQLRERYPKLIVKVSSARRLQGRGIEVRGISLSLPTRGKPELLASIDEVLGECDTHLPDFITHVPEFRRLRVRNLKIHARRQSDGSWNLARLIPAAGSRPQRIPAIALENGTLIVTDPRERSDRDRRPLSLRDINLTISPEEPPASAAAAKLPLVRLAGTLTGDHLSRVELQGLLDPADGRWELRGAVEGLEFNERLTTALPQEAGEALAPLSSIKGRSHFGFRLASRLPAGTMRGTAPALEFEADGQIADGTITDKRLPDPLTEVTATIHCDNNSLRIDQLSARCGQMVIETLTAELHGLSPESPLTVEEFSARQVDLKRLRPAVPAEFQEAWQRYAPEGTINVSGSLHFDGARWHPKLTADCLDLSVEYDRFKYRVDGGVGWIKLDYDRLTADVRFLAGSQTVRCTCEVRNPGKHFTGSIDIRSAAPILIDEEAIGALEPQWEAIVRSFRPRGSVAFTARFGRHRPADLVHRQIQLDLHELSIQYDKFGYPIDHIAGELLLVDNHWTFSKLKGQNDTAAIDGEGEWLPAADKEGNQLHLHFAAASVPIDDELRSALQPGVQRLWSHLRPRGTLDSVTVDLKYNPTRRLLAVVVDAGKQHDSQAGPLSVEPTWFRYRFDDVTGSFHYDSVQGLATLKNVRARHDKTTAQTEGTCHIYSDGSGEVRLKRLAAERINPDHELLAALPGGIGQALSRLSLGGRFNMDGTLGIVMPPRDGPPGLDWNLMFDVEDGSLQAGLPVSHIAGQVQLVGKSDAKGIVSRGELDIDSAMLRGIQLTQVRGPLVIDSQRLLAGTWAERDVTGHVPRWVTANAMGGKLALDGEFVFADGRFNLYTTLESADLKRVTQELSPSQRNLTGKVFGLVSLGGTTLGVHTWRGQGEARLTDADIYELPVMVSLLSLLSVKPPNRTAFTNSNMEFRIEGDDVEFTHIDFAGDAISLKGRGWMNNRQEVNLTFYTQLGRDEMQLPIFRPVVGEINRSILLIEVTGPLDHPTVTKRPLGGFSEQLSQMFPELAARADERREEQRGLWAGRKLLPGGQLWPRKE